MRCICAGISVGTCNACPPDDGSWRGPRSTGYRRQPDLLVALARSIGTGNAVELLFSATTVAEHHIDFVKGATNLQRSQERETPGGAPQQNGPRLHERPFSLPDQPVTQHQEEMTMSVFTESERAYLDSQPLGRLSTLSPDKAPQVRPVGFAYNRDLDTIDIGGQDLAASRKYRNIQADPRVSIVIDDLATIDPWSPRGIEIRGTAETLTSGDSRRPGFTADLIRIHPARVLAWGLDTDAFAPPFARNVHRDAR